MAESRNLNSGFLHTSFVYFDFTVAKIITILPTGYRAQLLYASYCFYRGETTLPTNLRPSGVTVEALYDGVCLQTLKERFGGPKTSFFEFLSGSGDFLSAPVECYGRPASHFSTRLSAVVPL